MLPVLVRFAPLLATTLHRLEYPRQVVSNFFGLVIDQRLHGELESAFIVHIDGDRAVPSRCDPSPRRPIAAPGSPSPNAARASLNLLQGEVLVLAINEGPNFIRLYSPHAKVVNVGIVVGSTGAAHVLEEI
jgi:hypothetical protein